MGGAWCARAMAMLVDRWWRPHSSARATSGPAVMGRGWDTQAGQGPGETGGATQARAGGWWGCVGGGSGGGCRPRGGLRFGQVGPLGSLTVQDHVNDLLPQLAWLGTTEPAASRFQHGEFASHNLLFLLLSLVVVTL